jgi:hypothetical protein
VRRNLLTMYSLLRNCLRPSKYKIYFAIWLFAGTFSDSAIATSVVMAVTPDRIVIGADGKGSASNVATLKIILLKGHLVVGDINLEHVPSEQGGTPLYDFPTWIGEIDKQARSNLSVTALSTIIKEESPGAFTFLSRLLRNGFTQDQAREKGLKANLVVQYVVAGYENAIPLVRTVNINIDWQSKTLRSEETLISPEKADSANHPYFWIFSGNGMERAWVSDSKEGKEFSSRVPVEAQIIARHGEFTGNQASNVIRSLLSIDAEANPTGVGFPLTIVTIPRIGRGFVKTYDKDVSPLSWLPKSKPQRPQKQKTR